MENDQLDNPNPEPSHDSDLNDATSKLSDLLGADVDAPSEAELQTPEKPDEEANKPAPDPQDSTPDEIEEELDGVKVKGKKDAIEKLKAERLMQADYTRKTMEAAELRKAAEQERMQIHQERMAYAQQLQTLTGQIQHAVQTGQLAPPDPSLLDSDPVTYLKQQQRWTDAQQAFAQAQQQEQFIRHQNALAQEQRLQQTLAAEREQLLAKLPELKDETKKQKVAAELGKYLTTELGFTPQELAGIHSHRALVLAYKSMQFDQLVKEQKAVIEKKTTPTQQRPVRPGGGSEVVANPLNKSAMGRLKSTGKVTDAVSAIASLL